MPPFPSPVMGTFGPKNQTTAQLGTGQNSILALSTPAGTSGANAALLLNSAPTPQKVAEHPEQPKTRQTAAYSTAAQNSSAQAPRLIPPGASATLKSLTSTAPAQTYISRMTDDGYYTHEHWAFGNITSSWRLKFSGFRSGPMQA
ncbi:hypothetical protein BDW72DRAFT_194257 [Aspergillus terricola var. indicus]